MRSQKLKIMVMTSVMLAGVCSAYAAEQMPQYELDQFLVTAQRYQKKDVDIAASTIVLTEKELQKTGATNLQQALSKVTGLIYQAKGPGGAALGTMTSTIVMRGIDSGTLVMVNGTPINLRGMYNLQDIPVENIERVEIIKGGGSVLYGSEATGGVINIITKKQQENFIKTSFGNYGQQSHALSLQAGKLGLSYSYDKWGGVDKVSDSAIGTTKNMQQYFTGSEKSNASLTYKFNDKLDLVYTHSEGTEKFDYYFDGNYSKPAAQNQKRYYRDYNTVRDFIQLNYENHGLKSNIYYNTQEREAMGVDYFTSGGILNKVPKDYYSRERNTTYGLDMQKAWELTKGKVLVGGTMQRELYNKFNAASADNNYGRNNFSVYAQLEHNHDKKNTTILSARETLSYGVRDFNNFSAQGQFIHKLDEEQSLYASIGQSFKMPTLAQLYSDGSVIGDSNLKPQVGMNYELGWKKNLKNHKWKVALFKVDLKDNIAFTRDKSDSSIFYAKNEDFKNIGLEASVDIEGKGGWSYNYGITLQNPQSKESNISGSTATKTYWDRALGKLMLTGGVQYKKDKLGAALSFSYLANRVMTPSSDHSYGVKPYLLTSLNVNYDFDKFSTLSLSVDNLFNRKDIISHTSSYYYSTPANFMLSYKLKF